jgi:hypothetical protein
MPLAPRIVLPILIVIAAVAVGALLAFVIQALVTPD